MPRRSSGKKKTSVSMDEELWKDWMKFCLDRYGSTRRASEELERALKHYLRLHERIEALAARNELVDELKAVKEELRKLVKKLDLDEKTGRRMILLQAMIDLAMIRYEEGS